MREPQVELFPPLLNRALYLECDVGAVTENVVIGRILDDVFFLDERVPVADFQIFKASFFVDALFFNRRYIPRHLLLALGDVFRGSTPEHAKEQPEG